MDVLTETELWREEHSASWVERELLLQQTLERRHVPTTLCQFIHGMRELRIPLNADGTCVVPSEGGGYSGASDDSPLRQHRLRFQLAHPAPSLRAAEHSAMHRLKYFSTRATDDGEHRLAVPLNGAADEPDARYDRIRRFLSRRRPVLLGRAVRAAMYNVIQQVALLHAGGCSHNDISLRSVCLVINSDGTPALQAAPPRGDGAATFLLTRFAFATEFLSDREHAVDVAGGGGADDGPGGVASSSPSAPSIAQQLANATRRGAQSAKLAIAPNILAICELDGVSAEKHYRAFCARQDAERHSRAQGRRPLPLATPVAGPVCDVVGLASVTAVLFADLLHAGDEIMGHKEVAFKLQQKELFSRNSGGGTDAQSKAQQQPQQKEASVASDANPFANHRFWSCDVEPALKKYVMGTTQDYMAKVDEWMRAPPRSSLTFSGTECAVRVVDEAIGSAQLAAFRIDVPDAQVATSSAKAIRKQQQQQRAGGIAKAAAAAAASAASSAHEDEDDGDAAGQQEPQQQQQSQGDGLEAKCSISTCGAPACELRWLLSRVLLQQSLPLPSAAQLRVHPFFWSPRRSAQFMVAAAQFLCEQELIAETLREFCNFSVPKPDIGGGGGRKASTYTLATPTNSRGGADKSVSSPQQQQPQQQQNDPDGVASKAAERLRSALSKSAFAALGSGHASSPARAAAVVPELQDFYDENSSLRRAGSFNGEVADPNLSAIASAFDAAHRSAMLMRTESMAVFSSDALAAFAGSSSPLRSAAAAASAGLHSAASFSIPKSAGAGNASPDAGENDDETPPNSVARMLNCSTTLYWWGRGEFRADARAHRDNCFVWLRGLGDILGGSQHPFSIINTKLGRIRNSRSDLLLFIAVLIARMVTRDSGPPVKICGGDFQQFVSIVLHSRFPGLQMLLLELISRRASDAQRFCTFVAEQENTVLRQPSLALPLFGATKDLWNAGNGSAPFFAEELAQMFTCWA